MLKNALDSLGKAAKDASYQLATRSAGQKDAFLLDLAENLIKHQDEILAANAKDLAAAQKDGMTPALMDRLALTKERISGIASSVQDVARLKDPVGDVLSGTTLENGVRLIRKRVPLGVVAVIYEARPNVTIDVAALCLKTGNAVILRGGKETLESNIVLVRVLQETLIRHSLPATTVQLIESPDRNLVSDLMRLDSYVDMLIPRGGASLQRRCQEESRIPIILGGIGVCHIFVDASAQQEPALTVLENAKVQRPSVCNTVETALIHKDIAQDFLPKLAAFMKEKKVRLHATQKALPFLPDGLPVTEEELSSEWLSLDLNVHVVDDIDEAIRHIRQYGSAHSDAILTECMKNAAYFVNNVDSAAVYVNASTRFTDGGEFGLGAEVAVSTQKLHARGPMGLEALTTYKWIAEGNYTIR